MAHPTSHMAARMLSFVSSFAFCTTRRTGALDWLWASYMAKGGTSRSLRVKSKFAVYVYSAWSESPSRVVSCSRAEEGAVSDCNRGHASVLPVREPGGPAAV